MSQIKDTARWVPTGSSKSLRQTGTNAIDGQISGLLARRNRLIEELASVDTKLADLRVTASGRAPAEPSEKDSRWFPIRGEQLIAGGFAVPPGLDREDLNRRVAAILVDERRGGKPIDGLELLVGFAARGGHVLSVRTRRSGDADWIRRFEALGRAGGH